jgi:hypothetical protein
MTDTEPIDTLRPDDDSSDNDSSDEDMSPVKQSGWMDTVKRVLHAARFAEAPKSSTTAREPDYVSPTIMFGVIGAFAMLMRVNRC